MFDILVFKVQEERAQREKEVGTKHSACKGLEEVVKLAFYMAEQRECFKHLMYNYVKKYKGAEHIYPTGRAYKKDVHDYHMNLKWYNSGFNPTIKYDYDTNNIDDVFNNWINDINNLLVSELADKVRERIMVLWHKRRKIGEMLDGRILPDALYVLKSQTRGLDHLTVEKPSGQFLGLIMMSY
jgi:hypothetical protein